MNFEGNQQSLLTFRVGPVLCCAPSLPVRSIITPPKLTHPPGSDSSQPGIFKHGSHIVKVLDLRKKFGIDDAEQTQPGNLIVTIFDGGDFAFWVDQILDVFDFPSEGWGNVPAAIPRGIFTRTLLLNNKIHLYSEFENLATVSDLGYLKHYIQQLKKQDEIKSAKEDDDLSSLKKKHQSMKTIDKKEVIIEQTKESNNSVTKRQTSEKINLTTNVNRISPVNNGKDENKKKEVTREEIKKITPAIIHKTSLKEPATRTAKIITPAKSTIQHASSKTNTTKQETRRNTTALTKKAAIPTSEAQTYSKKEIPQKNKYTKEKSDLDTEESSSLGIILFFLFLIFLLGGGFYYIFYSEAESNSKNKYTTTKPVQIEQVGPVEVDIPTIVTEQIKETVSPSIDNEVVAIEEISPSEDKNYKADISQQENEITITIHQPVSVEPTLAEEGVIEKSESNDIEATSEIITPVNTTVEIQVEKLKEEVAHIPEQKIINEVIHIVVKGDTLWAIAKKYVHNPFLYPELARLSNIKNPHRIYPGNRVRIRFIKY